ncbi:MAG: AI-2E family transporter [Clostridia bacterium]|nr:AI-2E family transporter [Clostridia bacterium]
MPSELKKLHNRSRITFLICYCAIFLILLVISYHIELNRWLGYVFDLFRPVLLGLAVAYVANPVFRFYERILFAHLRPSALRRALSLLCTYLSFFLLFALLLWLILPQLIASITMFVSNYQSYVHSAVNNINGIYDAINSLLGSIVKKDNFFQHIDNSQFFDWLYRLAVEFLDGVGIDAVTTTASTLISAVTDTIFALFISLYLLASKEKRYAQIMKLRTALFSNSTNITITRLCTTADNLFGKFFEGKLVDTLIVGFILYVFFTLFGIPYAIVLAAFIAIINIIPLIGFVIGAIPAALIVLLTDPERMLPFLVIVFIMFQIDTNIITPKILGNNTGVSSLCVLIAICVTSRLFGLLGMLLGVPLFATILDFSDQLIHRRLQKKRMPDDVENYYAPDPIINPMKTLNTGMASMIKRLEKRVLHAKKQIDSGNEAELTSLDRFALLIHRTSRRMKLLPETPADILTQFAAENAEKQIRHDAEIKIAEAMTRMLSADDAASETGGEEQ